MQGGGEAYGRRRKARKALFPIFLPLQLFAPFFGKRKPSRRFFVVFEDFDPIFASPRPEDECCRMQKLKKRGLSQFLPTGQIFYCAQCVHEDDLFVSP